MHNPASGTKNASTSAYVRKYGERIEIKQQLDETKETVASLQK